MARAFPGCLSFALLAALPLLGAACAASAAVDAPEGPDDRLWFSERRYEEPRAVFTAHALDPAAPDHDVGGLAGGLGTRFPPWFLLAAPADWRVEAGTVWEFSLWLSRLDEVVPTGEPLSDPDSLGQIRLQMDVEYGTVVATGTRYLSALAVEEGLSEHRVRVEFQEAVALRANATAGPDAETEYLRFTLSVTGRGVTGQNPTRFHFGAPTPSALQAPGYPVAAYRGWEEARLREHECALLLLQQRPCPGDAPGGEGAPGPEGRATPLPVVFSLLAAALAAATRARRGVTTACRCSPARR